jgi:hypothetical protein
MLTTYQKKDSEILRLEQLLGFCLMKIHAVVVSFRKKNLGSKFFTWLEPNNEGEPHFDS